MTKKKDKFVGKKLTKDQIIALTNDRRIEKYPWKIERWYARMIIKHVYSWENIAKTFVNEYIKPYVSGGVATLNDDNKHKDNIREHYGSAWYQLMEQNLNTLNLLIQHSLVEKEVNSEVHKFTASVDDYALASVKLQIGPIGINPIVSDNAIKDMLQGNIAYNVALIKKMNSKYAFDLQTDIYRTLEEGGGIGAITENIVNRTGMSIKHAKLIATDQTGKILGQLHHYRAKKAGAEYYTWQSMEDNRVRPAHQLLDQTVQKYDDPAGGDNGLMPGEPINCRCIDVAIFKDLDDII